MTIYDKCRLRLDKNGEAVILCKEVASLIRRRLKVEYPGVKFSVKTKQDCVSIYWDEGPQESEIYSATYCYKFGGYDGTVDLPYSTKNWLLPNGDMYPAECVGTGPFGIVDSFATDCPAPGAIIVKGGPSYIFAYGKDAACA
jgi:hypothetical protein